MRVYGINLSGNLITGEAGNLLIMGRCGTGKTHLATQLALDDCWAGNRVVYISTNPYGVKENLVHVQRFLPYKGQVMHLNAQQDGADLLQIGIDDLTEQFTLVSLRTWGHFADERDARDLFLPVIKHFLRISSQISQTLSVFIDSMDGYGAIVAKRLGSPDFQQALNEPKLHLTMIFHTLTSIPVNYFSQLNTQIQNMILLTPGVASQENKRLATMGIPAEELNWASINPLHFEGYLRDASRKTDLFRFVHLAKYDEVHQSARLNQMATSTVK